jgi:hypothetical protein
MFKLLKSHQVFISFKSKKASAMQMCEKLSGSRKLVKFNL